DAAGRMWVRVCVCVLHMHTRTHRPHAYAAPSIGADRSVASRTHRQARDRTPVHSGPLPGRILSVCARARVPSMDLAANPLPPPPPQPPAAAAQAGTAPAYRPPPNPTLYVRGLDSKIKKHELKRLLYYYFSQHGRIVDIVCVKSPRMRGQAH